MTRAGQIREALRASDKPMTSSEIVALVPGIRTHHAIGAMYRQGHVDRSGERGSYRYWLAREPISRKIYSDEERKARRAERERIRGAARRRAAGAMLFSEMVAERRAEAARRKAERDAERAKARAEREAKRNNPATKAEREAARAETNRKYYAKKRAERQKAKAAFLAAESKKRAKVNAAYNCAIAPAKPRLEDAPMRIVIAETVEEWMARTGQSPEVLPGVGAREAA